MQLVLVRHGNTFGPGDTPVWVGAKEDYPLVEKGLLQSRQMGKALVNQGLRLDRVIAGPLLRTRVGADLITEETGFSGDIEIDDRLKEIDYGSWGGKSDEDIVERYGDQVIEDWRERTIRPSGADWAPEEDVLKENALSVLEEVVSSSSEGQTALLVTSNGILRFYHAALYGDVKDAPSAKVKTGHMCRADLENGKLVPKFWNVSPDRLLDS